MKLSTKGRYGARLMLELALHHGNGLMLLKDISEHQDISEKYLGHLVPPLKAAGLVNSSRGAHGGYALAKDPKDINLEEIVSALEGNIALVECVASPDVCSRISFCIARDIWEEVAQKIKETLKGITLQDMVRMHEEKRNSKAFMYSI
ncbi:MAG: Rrf2 family transcriptional regulator [bacterium]